MPSELFFNIAAESRPQRILLIGLGLGPRREDEAERSLTELASLVDTAGGVEAGRRLFMVRAPQAATLLSKGHVEEAAALCGETQADVVAVDEELSPGQQRNLENAWDRQVLTRSEVILDIFARHAHTREGQIQVELAQLRYRLPRLTGRGVMLSRLGGGIGTRGPGEMKLEVDRRRIQQRIHRLEQDIEKVRRSRETQRRQRERSALPVAALVGYTNSGKSTLLGAISGADVYVADQLFATLDPTMRQASLPGGLDAAFSDTVGFIDRLPHTLIAAFRATLEEVLHADLLLQVLDASSDRSPVELAATERVLEEVGAVEKPRILVWNKIDLPGARERRAEHARLSEPWPQVEISALKGDGIAKLLEIVEGRLSEALPPMEIALPYDKAGLLDRIHREAKVMNVEYADEAIRIRLRPRAGLREALRIYTVSS